MSKPLDWLLFLAVAVLANALIAILTEQSEPSYQGQSYSYWLSQADSDMRDYHSKLDDARSRNIQSDQDESNDEADMAVAADKDGVADARDVKAANSEEDEDDKNPDTETFRALRTIGTNAIPTLLKWVKHEPHSWRDRLEPLIRHLPAPILGNATFQRWFDDPHPLARPYNVWLAFSVLGTNANCAIPELTRLMRDPTAEFHGCVAALSLSYIGPAGLPPLATAAADPQAGCRTWAISAIGQMHSNALPAIPLLIRSLNDTNPEVASVAANSLCILRLQPDLVLPALTNSLRSLDSDNRVLLAAWWLVKLEAYRPLARQLLLTALKDPSKDVREEAADAIRKHFPEEIKELPPD